MIQCIWIPYDFVSLIDVQIIIFSVTIIIQISFLRDQNKADLEKDLGMHNEIKGCRTQRLKDFLNQNTKESSEESKMEPTMTAKRVAPDEKNPKAQELEWHSRDTNILN